MATIHITLEIVIHIWRNKMKTFCIIFLLLNTYNIFAQEGTMVGSSFKPYIIEVYFDEGTGAIQFKTSRGGTLYNVDLTSYYIDTYSYDLYDNAKRLPIGFGIDNPTVSSKSTKFYSETAFTVEKTAGLLDTDGGNNDSVCVNICFATDYSTPAPSTLFASDIWVKSVSTGDFNTSFQDATVPANSWVWLRTSNKAGTVSQLSFTVHAKYDNK